MGLFSRRKALGYIANAEKILTSLGDGSFLGKTSDQLFRETIPPDLLRRIDSGKEISDKEAERVANLFKTRVLSNCRKAIDIDQSDKTYWAAAEVLKNAGLNEEAAEFYSNIRNYNSLEASPGLSHYPVLEHANVLEELGRKDEASEVYERHRPRLERRLQKLEEKKRRLKEKRGDGFLGMHLETAYAHLKVKLEEPADREKYRGRREEFLRRLEENPEDAKLHIEYAEFLTTDYPAACYDSRPKDVRMEEIKEHMILGDKYFKSEDDLDTKLTLAFFYAKTIENLDKAYEYYQDIIASPNLNDEIEKSEQMDTYHFKESLQILEKHFLIPNSYISKGILATD